MSERISCLVPFCRRTTKRGQWLEWICGEHWRNVPPRLKLLKRRARRRYLRETSDKHAEACRRIWEKCKQKAVTLQ